MEIGIYIIMWTCYNAANGTASGLSKFLTKRVIQKQNAAKNTKSKNKMMITTTTTTSLDIIWDTLPIRNMWMEIGILIFMWMWTCNNAANETA